ncbi:hypothetical protein GPECTOR_7g1264 [Gonium pectorale]|uniref:Phosphoribulokinase/uridine kinase domain-containing protein n=1 Tax=Gonium pectorale TaxID=33097 RepID=A0A150GUK1_GONPE|nr:hypothetical protein GPECTOR_7g1264 [Gonium pectorale]|eukprot:KXZ53368.1 hypothetical protein GPECTOR_7g1264 [Gonium pectorale]
MSHLNVGPAGIRAGSARIPSPSCSGRNSPALLPGAAPISSTVLTTSQTTAPLRRPVPLRAPIALAASPASQAVCVPFQAGDLADYILSGPLLASCGISPDSVRANVSEWERLGRQLATQLEFDHDHMDPVQRLRIYHYYLPVYWWVAAQLEAHRASGSDTALVLGISAPQGCGKTTLVEQLEALFNAEGRPAASVSIDDFYLTRAQQAALAEAHPGNRLLQLRGNAGTHDLQLGTDTLTTLRALRQPGDSAAVPRYNKSAFGGLGDRADPSTWPVVGGPLQVVFFEGWMSGFAPLHDDAAAAAVDPALAAVNAALRSYRAAWDDLVDSWLVVRIGDPQWVYQWRLQAEERMKASGKAGMSDAQIADFVSRFMPAYTAYLPGLYAAGPTTARPGRTLILEVDRNRSPVQQQPAPVV